MYILMVTPLARSTRKGMLTYFSKELIEVGSIVTVPLRGRAVPALVIESNKASDEKIILKNSDYKLKKIVRANPVRHWNTSFIKAVEETSRVHLQEFSETLLLLTPKAVLDAYLDKQLLIGNRRRTINKGISPARVLAIQGDKTTRIESYQRLVRRSLKQNKSVFICVPTQDDAGKTASEFSEYKEKLRIFHSGIPKKKLLKQWGEVTEESLPIVMVGTPQYLSLPRYFATIILEEEHARSWKTFIRPFIDMRFFVESYARETGSALVLGAPLLRLETHKKIIDGEIKFIAPHREPNRQFLIIDPRIEEKDIRERTGVRMLKVLSKEVCAMIEYAQEKGENIFLLVARKGLAPLVMCGDCGATIRCPVCDKLLALHKKQGAHGTRIFSCHACGFKRVPEEGEHETCPQCGGWRLESLGIGIERVEEEVKKLFPRAECFVLDGDHTRTPTSARKTITSFEKSQGILIGTPMTIPFLSSVSGTAIVSLDSLFAIPDVGMSERIFALMLTLQEKTKGKLLVQTRIDNTTLFEQALAGDIEHFVKDELAVRKTFLYPPYGTIVKITLRGAQTKIPAEMARLKTFLLEYNPFVPKTITHKNGAFQMHMILKLSEEVLCDKKFLSKLHTLPPQFTFELNPDNLL